jgi:hypothetical protein
VFNDEPSKVKVFRTSSLESNGDNWLPTFTSDNGSTANITAWEEKENIYRKLINRTSDSSAFSATFGLGDISAISTKTLTISGLDIYSLGVSVGDAVYKDEALIGEITSIDAANQITLDIVTGLSAGDFIYVKKTATIEGDVLRGYYVEADFSNTESENDEEVYAVNTDVVPSKLHNT